MRLENLQKIENEYRQKQDSLYLITSLKLDEAIRGRITSESDLNDKLIDIIKSGIDGNADKDLIGGNDSNLEPQRSSGRLGKTAIWIGAALFILGLFGALIIMMLRKQQNPIYLKPKTTTPPPNGKKAPTLVENNLDQTKDDQEKTMSYTETNANENEDVVRSELKSLRQSAVAMSVSQKDGANQIVSDWLDSEKAENSNELEEEQKSDE